MISKRGVSPLIATVLLIAFAVALGAVVMNWGHDQIETDTACDKVDFKIEQIGGNANICYVEGVRKPGEEYAINTLEILATNQGSKPIDNVILSIIPDSGGPLNPVLDVKMNPYESKKLSFDYKSTIGILRKVTIIPTLTIQEETEEMPEEILRCKTTEVQSVPKCQI